MTVIDGDTIAVHYNDARVGTGLIDSAYASIGVNTVDLQERFVVKLVD